MKTDTETKRRGDTERLTVSPRRPLLRVSSIPHPSSFITAVRLAHAQRRLMQLHCRREYQAEYYDLDSKYVRGAELLDREYALPEQSPDHDRRIKPQDRDYPSPKHHVPPCSTLHRVARANPTR